MGQRDTDDPARSRGAEQPQEPAIVEPGEPPTAPQWFRRRRVLIGAGAVVLAAGTVAGIALADRGPGTITVHGTLAVHYLTDLDGSAITTGDRCEGTDKDGAVLVTAATTLTISGSSGQTLTVIGVTGGTVADGSSMMDDSCMFSFSAQVPAGQSSYTVALAGHGSQTFTPAQAQSGVALTLGG